MSHLLPVEVVSRAQDLAMALDSDPNVQLEDTSESRPVLVPVRPVLYHKNSYGERSLPAKQQFSPKQLSLGGHQRTASTGSNASESGLPTPKQSTNLSRSLYPASLASNAMNSESFQPGTASSTSLLAKRRPQFHLPEASTSYAANGTANGESDVAATHRIPLSANAPLLSPSACYVHSQFDSALSNSSAMNQQAEERKARKKRKKTGQRTPSGIDAQKSPEIHSMMSSVVQSLNKANNMDTPRRNPANLHPNAMEDESDSSTASEDDSSDLSGSEDEASSLTRKLAETATSVREMSKQLGRARIKSNINSIMIITKARDNHLIRLTREMAIWIMTEMPSNKERGVTVYVDHQLKKSKRFDAAGIERDYPYLFRPLARRPSRRGSAVSVPTLSSLAEGNIGTARRSKVNIKLTSNTPTSRPTTPYTSGHGREPSGDSDEGQLRYWDAAMCTRSPQLFDFVITLGGDGTVLFASWLFQRVSPPIIPFSLGSLGFLTNQDFKNHQNVLSSVANEGVRVNLRMRFTCTVYRAVESDCGRRAVRSGKTGQIFTSDISNNDWDTIEGGAAKFSESGKDKEVMCFTTRPVEQFEVINDLTVDRGPSPYVSLLELFGDEQHITTVQADGLCISTPTGSTAYSLSAGGSLVHPEIPAILVTPICPHTLSFRPVLLPDSMEIRLCVPYNSRATAWASFDGRGRIELRQGDHIKVTASQYPFPTVCAETQSSDWFHSIARTLKWNERQRQKSFVVIEEDKQSEPVKNTSADKQQTGDTAHVPRQEAATEVEEEEDGTFDIDDCSEVPSEASTPSSPRAKVDAKKSSVSKASANSTHSLHDVLVDRFAASAIPHPPRLSHRHTAASRLEHDFTPHDGESGDRDWQHEPEQKRSNNGSSRFAHKKPLSPTKAKEVLENDQIARRPSQNSGHRAFAMFGEDHSESESEISESPE